MSSSSYNQSETLSTLRFGQRAKSIVNKAVKNEERSAAELTAALTAAEKKIEAQAIKIKRLEAACKEAGVDIASLGDIEISAEEGVEEAPSSKPPSSIENEAMEEILEELTDKNVELEDEVERINKEMTDLQALLKEKEREAELRSGSAAGATALESAVKELMSYAAKVRPTGLNKEGEEGTAVERTLSWGSSECEEIDLNRVSSSIGGIVSELSLSRMKEVYEIEERKLAIEALETERLRLETELKAAQEKISQGGGGGGGGVEVKLESRDAEAALEATSQATQDKLDGLTQRLKKTSSDEEVEEAAMEAELQEELATSFPEVEDDEDEEEVEIPEDLTGVEADVLVGHVQLLKDRLEKSTVKRKKEHWLNQKLKAFHENRSPNPNPNLNPNLKASHENRSSVIKEQASVNKALEEELCELKEAWEAQKQSFEKLKATLQNDLNQQVERYISLKVQVEEEKSSPTKEGAEQSKEREMIVSLQRRLDSVTSDHQWLLQQYVAINTQAGDLRKKASLREDHVKELETAMHQLSARHEDEIAKLSTEISKAQARELQMRDAIQTVSLENAAGDLFEGEPGDFAPRERSVSFEEKLKTANESFSGRLAAQLNKVVAPLRADGANAGIPQSPMSGGRIRGGGISGGTISTPIRGGGEAPAQGSEAAKEATIWGRMTSAFKRS